MPDYSDEELEEAVERVYEGLPEPAEGPERPSDQEIDEALEAAVRMQEPDGAPEEGLEEAIDMIQGRR